MSSQRRIPGEDCAVWVAALVMVSCSATPGARSSGKNPPVPAASATAATDSKDAGTPLHLWEAGPGVKEAPRTNTRPYVPAP